MQTNLFIRTAVGAVAGCSLVFGVIGCDAEAEAQAGSAKDGTPSAMAEPTVPEPEQALPQDAETGELVLAGGCFWCVEAVFEPLVGVDDVVSGFAGGSAEDATYDLVTSGQTKHAEAVKITYDPQLISYGKLLQVFFATHDPLTANGQNPDFGEQYRPAVFVHGDAQRQTVQAYIDQLGSAGIFDKPVATGIETLDRFYPAEEYHQDFVAKNPGHPYVVQWAMPKIAKVKKMFPDLLENSSLDQTDSQSISTEGSADDSVGQVEKTEQEWREQLSDEAFQVLRKEGTERPFSSPLNDIKKPGTFVCAGCDLAVFETKTKFKSGTGWPSFYAPIAPSHVKEVEDKAMGMVRTEVECARCGGHLGHIFHDGPEPTGLRYCVNGVAMKFEPTK